MIPEEILLIIIGYCEIEVNLFLISKQFERLCTLSFDPTDGYDWPLRKSCIKNNLDAVKKLLKDNRVLFDKYDTRAVENAAENNNLEIFNLLINDPRIYKEKSLARCLRYDCNIKKSILENIKSYSFEAMNHFILVACWQGDMVLLDFLLKCQNIDFSIPVKTTEDEQKIYVIIRACAYYSLQVLERLLQDPRIDPTIFNNLALYCAITNGRDEITDRLLQDPRVLALIN